MAVSGVHLCFYLLLAYHVIVIALWDPSKRPLTGITDTLYDYIIVGGGSAGCVLANRLSEDENVTVLLVEAGDMDDNWEIKTPMATTSLLGSTVDWQFVTHPQKSACYGMTAQKAAWPSGKVLGGSSSINWMAHVRGNKADYDHWERVGAEGWSYKDVLPYFKKMEEHHGEYSDAGYHGFDGPMTVGNARFHTPVAKAFVEGGVELGYERVDYNGKSQIGFNYFKQTIRDGSRCSASRAYLHPVRDRKNLFVAAQKSVRTLKVVNDRIDGVNVVNTREFNRGPEKLIRARKEVILSAGAIGSPHILMLSGIGPKDHLFEAKIPLVKDLPVGEHLQDHLMVVLPYVLNAFTPESGVSFTKPYVDSPLAILEYFLFGSGPLSTNSFEATAFMHSGLEPEGQGPDIQLLFEGASMSTEALQSVRFSPQGIALLWGYELMQDKPLAGFTIFPTVLHPKSVGTVKLDTVRYPLEPPFINPNYLNSSEDIEVLLKGIRMAQKVVNTGAFKDFRGQLLAEHAKGPYQYDTDDFWRWYIPQLSLTAHNPTGTCKMGTADDPTTVVDPRLRVKGFTNLRVVDASVMPEIVSGNTNTPTIMIAEKAADMIKEDSQKD